MINPDAPCFGRRKKEEDLCSMDVVSCPLYEKAKELGTPQAVQMICCMDKEYMNGFRGIDYTRTKRFICLAMTEKYIEDHFSEIIGHESEIESRLIEADCTPDGLPVHDQVFSNS